MCVAAAAAAALARKCSTDDARTDRQRRFPIDFPQGLHAAAGGSGDCPRKRTRARAPHDPMSAFRTAPFEQREHSASGTAARHSCDAGLSKWEAAGKRREKWKRRWAGLDRELGDRMKRRLRARTGALRIECPGRPVPDSPCVTRRLTMLSIPYVYIRRELAYVCTRGAFSRASAPPKSSSSSFPRAPTKRETTRQPVGDARFSGCAERAPALPLAGVGRRRLSALR